MNVGLSVGLAGAPQSGAAPEPNPNLLRWSEQFQQAVWTATDCTVTADDALGGDGTMTADKLVFIGDGTIGQVSTVAAISGPLVSDSVTPGAVAARYDIAGTFDGAQYVFSVELTGPGGSDIFILMRRLGGFISCELVDGGDGATFHAWGAKLETPSSTAYVKREGT